MSTHVLKKLLKASSENEEAFSENLLSGIRERECPLFNNKNGGLGHLCHTVAHTAEEKFAKR